jgi:hypothetical protein
VSALRGFTSLACNLPLVAAIRRAGESFYPVFVQISAKLFDKGVSD